MFKRSIITFLSVISITLAGWAVLAPAAAFADTPKNEVCKGIGAASGSGCTSSVNLTTIVRRAINVFSVIIGIIAVIMIMIAGFKFITSGGDSGGIASARQTLIYAIVGLIVVALSQGIVRFVLRAAS